MAVKPTYLFKSPVTCFDSYWAIFRLCIRKTVWTVWLIHRVCRTLVCMCNCMQPETLLMSVETCGSVGRLYVGICAHTNHSSGLELYVRGILMKDFCIADIMQTHRRLTQYRRHCLYISRDHSRRQFRRRRLFRRRPQFFFPCCLCMHMCTWRTETHSKINFFLQSVWVALSRPWVSKPRDAAAFLCYVYSLPQTFLCYAYSLPYTFLCYVYSLP